MRIRKKTIGKIFALALIILAVKLAIREKGRQSPITILAVGESTTAQGGEQGWPLLLERSLNAECPSRNVKVVPFAVSGADSSDLAARMGAGLSIYHPRAVVMMAGINDLPNTADVTAEDQKVFGAHFSSFAQMQDALYDHILHHDPLNDRRYIFRFAQPFRDAQLGAQAFGHDESTMAAFPDHVFASLDLGNMHRSLGHAEESRRWHDWAAGVVRKKPSARPQELIAVRLETIADLAPDWSKVNLAAAAIRKENPESAQVDFFLANLFSLHGRLREQESILRGILKYGRAYEQRLALYRLADNLFRQSRIREANALKLSTEIQPFPVTIRNLRNLAGQIRDSRALLFPMQYPLRDPTPLRENLKKFAEQVISNEQGFENARNLESYSNFFFDRFAGDFGHFQPAASTLVASHAAVALTPWLNHAFPCGTRN